MTLRKLKYTPTAHAIERFREYYGTKEIHAVDFANDLMRGAQFVMNQPDGRRIYQNDEYDTMVILGAKDNVVITVNPSALKRKELSGNTSTTATIPESARVKHPTGNPVIEAAHTTIKRELTKSRRIFTKEYRRLTEEIAVIGLEIAQHTLNKARARSPVTQKHIADKVSEIHAEQTQLAEQRKRLEAEYRAVKAEAQAFISIETA